MPVSLKTRVEQIRQARKIHGGTLKMCCAAIGVKLARVPIPVRLREPLYRKVYGSKYAALQEDELERPLSEFRSLNDLFTRGVRPECRPLPTATNQYLSPCDGLVQDLGQLRSDTLLTVKGIEYPLSSLLPEMETSRFENGAFGIFFLSPADCHRIFSPYAGLLHEIVHVPGRRLLVHPPFQRKEFPVFSLNERVILRMETPLGGCLLVLVAGWGVGNITHPFLPRPSISKHRITRQQFDAPLLVERGEWIATFELGSTAILIAERGPGLAWHVARDAKVNYGQAVFSYSAR